MTRVAFKQADVQRIFRAAKSEGMAVSIDIRSLVITAIPSAHLQNELDAKLKNSGMIQTSNFAQFGKENWDED
jgi:hypothetical protein